MGTRCTRPSAATPASTGSSTRSTSTARAVVLPLPARRAVARTRATSSTTPAACGDTGRAVHEEGRYLEVVARLVHWAIEGSLLDAGSESICSWAGSVPHGANVTRNSCSLTCSINESDLSLHDEPFFNIT